MMERFDSERNVIVTAERLAMVVPFISHEETRYFLNGVYIGPHEKKGVVIVATDGHRLGAVHDEDGITNGEWICAVPRLTATAAAKRNNRRGVGGAGQVAFVGQVAYVVTGQFEMGDFKDIGKNHLSIEHAPAIDGTFPDWRRVVPTGAGDVGCFSFNASYLADFRAVGRFRNSTQVQIASGGDQNGPAIVRIPSVPEFLGVLMPMRAEPTLAGVPEWFAPPVPEKQPKQPKRKAA